MKRSFIQPRFVGARFLEHTLPVDVAKDLAAYEMLVTELAKHLFLEDHGDRQRVPKGFSTEFHLHIERIDDGSAKPLLSVVMAGALALNGGSADYFERARDLISECIASGGERLPTGFPRELLHHFNNFGRSLRDDESLELPRPQADTPATLTPDVRKRLVLAADRVYEKEIEISGTIGEADWERSTFRLRLPDGSQTIIPMPESFHDKAREFGGRIRHQVVLQGVAAFDSWDKLQKVVAADHLEIQRNFDLIRRLEEIATIENGWFDGHGLAPDKQCISEISAALEVHYPEDLALPIIVPTQEGNLLFEWEVSGSPSLDIDLKLQIAEFHSFGFENEIERTFNLREENAWAELFGFLQEQFGGVTA